VCLCIFVSVCLCAFPCPCPCVRVSVYVSVRLSVCGRCLCLCLFVLCVYRCLCRCVCECLFVSVCEGEPWKAIEWLGQEGGGERGSGEAERGWQAVHLSMTRGAWSFPNTPLGRRRARRRSSSTFTTGTLLFSTPPSPGPTRFFRPSRSALGFTPVRFRCWDLVPNRRASWDSEPAILHSKLGTACRC
jgi:hypothetical protein